MKDPECRIKESESIGSWKFYFDWGSDHVFILEWSINNRPE